jgi:hypothetical protein
MSDVAERIGAMSEVGSRMMMSGMSDGRVFISWVMVHERNKAGQQHHFFSSTLVSLSFP